MTTDKSREIRIRRMLARQGYVLHKSRRRDPLAVGYGHYTITKGSVTVFGAATGRTLDDVKKWALEKSAPPAPEVWEQIGEVAVDTGRLLLADPCQIEEIISEWYCGKPLGFGGYSIRGRPDGRGLAMIVGTADGDGFYPVSVARTEDGRIAKVLVDFLPLENDD
jgi:hypothetical protein